MRVVSIFSGIGGGDLGFELAGATVVAQVEVDDPCQQILRRHWPGVPIFGDVSTLKGVQLPACDAMVGGFPCQDISVAGARAGLAGDRSGLWFEFARLIDEVRPQWVLIENVAGLLSSNRGRDMGTVVGTLGDLGYGWAYRVLDAQYFGIPQRRRRVFIAGCTGDGERAREVLFESEGRSGNPPKSRTARSAAPVAGALTKSFGAGGPDPAHAEAGWIGLYPAGNGQETYPSEVVNGTVGTLQGHSDGSGYRLGADEVAAGHVLPVARCLTTGQSRRYDVDSETLVPVAYSVYPESGQGADLRATKVSVVPTIGAETLAKQAERGTHIVEGYRPIRSEIVDGVRKIYRKATKAHHPGDWERWEETAVSDTLTERDGTAPAVTVVEPMLAVRRLTPLECERLQGFPDHWTHGQVDTHRYRQLGNAMPVPVLEWIARRMMKEHNA